MNNINRTFFFIVRILATIFTVVVTLPMLLFSLTIRDGFTLIATVSLIILLAGGFLWLLWRKGGKRCRP